MDFMPDAAGVACFRCGDATFTAPIGHATQSVSCSVELAEGDHRLEAYLLHHDQRRGARCVWCQAAD